MAVPAIAFASLCAVLPWLHYGIPSGHDFEFHMNSWMEVVDHWRQGILYPHWAAWAHDGYGDSRFSFYPPFSWTLGAVLGAVLPWKLVPAVFVWIALTLAGLAMFALARTWLSTGAALFAAIFYALNPYHLVIVYWRSAFAELLASALFPLLLLRLLRGHKARRMIVPVSLVLAAGWLTNIPSAIMLHYALAAVVICLSISQRTLRPVVYAGIAVIAGAGLAAVNLVPILHQRSWVSLDQVLSPGLRPADSFLFAHTADPDHDKFNHLISWVAACEFALLALTFLELRAKRNARPWWPLVVLGSFCFVVMLPFTNLLWEHLPQLRFIQFPWRWLLVLNVAFVFALASISSRWIRIAACMLAFAPVLFGARHILAPWWDTAADVRELLDNQHDHVGYEDVDEYAPAGVDVYDVDQHAPLAQYSGQGSAKIIIDRWNAEHRVVSVQATATGVLTLKLFNYPQWLVMINGRKVSVGMNRHYAMTVPVEAGSNTVEVRFVGGGDRPIGGAVSLASLLCLILWYKRETGVSRASSAG